MAGPIRKGVAHQISGARRQHNRLSTIAWQTGHGTVMRVGITCAFRRPCPPPKEDGHALDSRDLPWHGVVLERCLRRPARWKCNTGSSADAHQARSTLALGHHWEDRWYPQMYRARPRMTQSLRPMLLPTSTSATPRGISLLAKTANTTPTQRRLYQPKLGLSALHFDFSSPSACSLHVALLIDALDATILTPARPTHLDTTLDSPGRARTLA